MAAAPERVIPVRDGDATPARVRERDAVAAAPRCRRDRSREAARRPRQRERSRRPRRRARAAGSCGSRPPRRRRRSARSPCVDVCTTAPSAPMAADSILQSPRKRTPSPSSAARAASETRGRKRASGRSSMSSERHVVRRGERRGRLGADQPGADDDDPPAGLRERLDERDEARAGGVLLGLLEPGNRRLRVAQAGRPDERRRRRSRAARLRPRAPRPGDGCRGRRSSRRRRCGRCLARRAGRRPRAAERDRSGAHAWRAAADRGAGPARSSSRGTPRSARRAAHAYPDNTVADDDDVIHTTHISASCGTARVGGTADPSRGKRRRSGAEVADAADGAGGDDRSKRDRLPAALHASVSAPEPERIMVAEAASARPGRSAPSRRELFAVAAALAATVLTGAAAVAGLTRRVPAAPTVPRSRPDHHARRANRPAARRARRLTCARSGQPSSRPGRSSPCSPLLAWTRPQAAARRPDHSDGRRRARARTARATSSSSRAARRRRTRRRARRRSPAG